MPAACCPPGTQGTAPGASRGPAGRISCREKATGRRIPCTAGEERRGVGAAAEAHQGRRHTIDGESSRRLGRRVWRSSWCGALSRLWLA